MLHAGSHDGCGPRGLGWPRSAVAGAEVEDAVTDARTTRGVALIVMVVAIKVPGRGSSCGSHHVI